MSDKHADDREPIDPRTAQKLHLDRKETQSMEPTVRGHRYRRNHFVRRYDQRSINDMNDFTGPTLTISALLQLFRR